MERVQTKPRPPSCEKCLKLNKVFQITFKDYLDNVQGQVFLCAYAL